MRKFEVVTGYEEVAKLPKRSTKHSAGYDFHTTNSLPVLILPQKTVVFDTGIKVSMESDEVLLMHIRSSIGIKRGLILSNCTGVIDADYYNNPDNEGHIRIALTNIGDVAQTIKPQEKVAQGIFMKYITTDDDVASGDRTGGIGSTGK
nr:MAG TPA: deoxyuridine 5'-triphosphate nucleotidohydrolase [Caudoviricetes sp.]